VIWSILEMHRVRRHHCCLAGSPGDLPEAPSSGLPAAFVPNSTPIRPLESKILDKKFIALAIVSTGSTFADSYTTLFARQNWLAGKQGVCNVESESPYLYGRHPTVARAYLVASVKAVASAAASFYLRKQHRKWWSLPLVLNSALSLQGATQNMISCN
jgi:hypothetical protein